MPASNRLDDHTGHHFAKDDALQALAQGSPGSEKEPRRGGAGVTDADRWRGDGTWTLLAN